MSRYSAELKELSPEQYPDNSDASIKHSRYENIKYRSLFFQSITDSTFTLELIPDHHTDTIVLRNISLSEFVPTVCQAGKKDSYIARIGVINQEWNRNQVQFEKGDFEIKSDNADQITRVDIARNCINAYLWEVILYAEEDGKSKPYYHGWFNFPKELYGKLFEARNQMAYKTYQKELENWYTPETKRIQLKSLRSVVSEQEVSFRNLNHLPYALTGERKKKYGNIIFPKNTTVIQDFLTDATSFATFSPPGMYTKADPRKTYLGSLAQVKKMVYRTTRVASSPADSLFEIEIVFENEAKTQETHFFISGLKRKEIPVLDSKEVDKGWQNSMGFGNHTFYETYAHARSHGSKRSPYFSFLSNEDGQWLDSHKIGIDGPLLHWDAHDPSRLHLWILSFERHAFVGHYVLNLKN